MPVERNIPADLPESQLTVSGHVTVKIENQRDLIKLRLQGLDHCAHLAVSWLSESDSRDLVGEQTGSLSQEYAFGILGLKTTADEFPTPPNLLDISNLDQEVIGRCEYHGSARFDKLLKCINNCQQLYGSPQMLVELDHCVQQTAPNVFVVALGAPKFYVALRGFYTTAETGQVTGRSLKRPTARDLGHAYAADQVIPVVLFHADVVKKKKVDGHLEVVLVAKGYDGLVRAHTIAPYHSFTLMQLKQHQLNKLSPLELECFFRSDPALIDQLLNSLEVAMSHCHELQSQYEVNTRFYRLSSLLQPGFGLASFMVPGVSEMLRRIFLVHEWTTPSHSEVLEARFEAIMEELQNR